MIRFLGIILKASTQPRDAGGYGAYFQPADTVLYVSKNCEPIRISRTAGFAQQVMTLKRYKQIRGAFHAEDKNVAMSGDKCHQVRHLLNCFNAAAARVFLISLLLAFDEGGIGIRSRFCPCRMYNKDKPDKYRVEFFLMACAVTYAILHIDVYQGKNARNIGIHPDVKDLPTSQKAVANACYRMKLHVATECVMLQWTTATNAQNWRFCCERSAMSTPLEHAVEIARDGRKRNWHLTRTHQGVRRNCSMMNRIISSVANGMIQRSSDFAAA